MADLLRMPPCQNLLKAFAEPGNELFVSNSTICRAPNNFASRNSKQPFCPSKAMPISAEEKPTGASQVQVPSGGAARTTESEVSVDHAEMKNGPFFATWRRTTDTDESPTTAISPTDLLGAQTPAPGQPP